MTVTQTVLDSIRALVLTDIEDTISHIAVGDDDTTPVVGDTALGNETYRDSLLTESSTSNTYSAEIFLDTTENNGDDIKEAGSFNQASGGTMFTRTLTNVISKIASIEATAQLDILVTTINS